MIWVFKKVREWDGKLKYERIEEKEDLIIVRIGNASFKTCDKALGEVFLFLSNSAKTKASPIY